MSGNVGKAIDIIGLALLFGIVLRYGTAASTLLATGISGTAAGTTQVVTALRS